jgi:hypothetical protein
MERAPLEFRQAAGKFRGVVANLEIPEFQFVIAGDQAKDFFR